MDTAETMEPRACVLCGDQIVGFGNNAAPLAEGKCCDACNGRVILRRMASERTRRLPTSAQEHKRGGNMLLGGKDITLGEF